MLHREHIRVISLSTSLRRIPIISYSTIMSDFDARMDVATSSYTSMDDDCGDEYEWEDENAPAASSSSSSSAAAPSSSSSRPNMDPESVCVGDDAPELANMKMLIKRYPHLTVCKHVDVVDAKNKGSSSSSAILTAAIRESPESAVDNMVAASKVDIWQSDVWQKARRELGTAEFFVKTDPKNKLTQAELTELLTRKQHKMCVQSASLESMLLVESGTWTTSYDDDEGKQRHYPACSKGVNCIGTKSQYWIRGQKRNVVWTAMMYNYEWDDFVESGSHAGVPRMCVLDHRKVLPSAVAIRRLMNMRGVSVANDVNYVDASIGDSNQVRQVYYNLVDRDDGYHKQYVFLAEPGEAMLEPIVRLNTSTVKAVQLASGQMRVDQSMMIYDDTSSSSGPSIGENMASF